MRHRPPSRYASMPSSPSRRKHALLIGINTYPNLTKYEHLKGCINDVRAMARLLEERFGFLEEDVTVLEDAEATRAGILAALDALADRVGTDDVVVLFYAGHGSQVTDLEGDEPDGLDETICPYDTTREGGRNVDITDDELHAWILRVTAKTPFLTLLFDSCHSGTISRDPSGGQTRSLRPDTRPAEALGRTPVTTPATRSAGTEVGPSGWLPLGERYVLIAGCRDDERSKEYKIPESGERQGMLTYALLGALQDAAAGTTYRDVFERVRLAVNALNPKQHPQMEGALDRELFGVHDIEPMRFFGVERRDGARVTLAGGAAHGLTAGSALAVYPPGTKTTEGAVPLGRLVIRRVGALASEADLEEDEDGAVGPGARAVETAHAHPEARLRVEVVVPEGFDEARAALVAEIEGSELLEVAAGGEGFDVRAYLVPERAERADPVPQLGAVSEPTWAVVSGGELVMPVHAVSERGVVRLLRENLEKLARYRYALALANPDAGSRLRGTLHVRLERQGPDGTWEEATPDAPGGEVVFHEGDRIAFTITHTHDAPLYVYALDFDIDGGVNPLTMRGASERLEPNRSLRVTDLVWEDGQSRPIVLEFPERFPGAEGTATLKVFATTHETSFDAL
ncbi:MAG: caspase family protein, partial [Rubricoccaceae bacterium]|nr:caspase family protein [Rubricoccaceae bacterium]